MRHAYGNAYIHSDVNANGDGNTYANSNANVDSDCNSNCNCNCYSIGECDPSATTYADATASADTAATSVIG